MTSMAVWKKNWPRIGWAPIKQNPAKARNAGFGPIVTNPEILLN